MSQKRIMLRHGILNRLVDKLKETDLYLYTCKKKKYRFKVADMYENEEELKKDFTPPKDQLYPAGMLIRLDLVNGVGRGSIALIDPVNRENLVNQREMINFFNFVLETSY